MTSKEPMSSTMSWVDGPTGDPPVDITSKMVFGNKEPEEVLLGL